MAETSGIVNYIADIPLYRTEKPYSLSGDTYTKSVITNVHLDERKVTITNARGRENEFQYDSHAFRFLKFPSAVEWDGSQQKSLEYLEEAHQFLLNEFQADRVICYDIRRRNTGPSKELKTESYFERSTEAIAAPPIRRVHCDHSFTGGFERMKRHLTDNEVKECLGSGWRTRIVNIWRPLKSVERYPITVVDCRTVALEDLMETDQVNSTYCGETFTLKHNPSHRFYWLERQQPDEIAVMVNFDAYNGLPAKSFRCCAHTAFENPSTHENAPPRESVEIRAIVFNKLKDG